MKQPCVYILASNRNGALYIGVTSDLEGRMAQHDQGLIEGFTRRYSQFFFSGAALAASSCWRRM